MKQERLTGVNVAIYVLLAHQKAGKKAIWRLDAQKGNESLLRSLNIITLASSLT
jgi:hypothetical protein